MVWATRDLKGRLGQHVHRNELGHFQPDQAAQTRAQSDLKCLQGWRIWAICASVLPCLL